MRFRICLIVILGLLVQCRSVQESTAITSTSVYPIQKTATSEKAMVVSAHPMASEVGIQVMKEGGNAIDAAIAVQFALAVTFPVAGNIGGGGFMVIRLNDGTTDCVDFREAAPLKGHRDMYLDADGNVIDGLSLAGHLASGVPGTVDGMDKAFKKYSKIQDWKKLIQPSVDLAQEGFQLTARQARGLNGAKQRFEDNNTVRPIFVKEVEWKPGDKLVQIDLSHTLKRIRDEGRAGFYEGETAKLIVEEMERGNGLISYVDLKSYEAKWRTPIATKYKNYKIISMPPASSGGIALTQLMKMVEDQPLSDWGHHDPRTIHLMIEAERRVYADRAKHLGDSDFYPVPVQKLISDEYIAQRSADINMTKATASDDIYAGKFIESESEETTHFSVVDQWGNAVSVTTTINTGYGCKTVVGGAGFLLNNEMDDFSIKVGVPNAYGLVGAEANAIAPGKRMLSSMTPTIVEKDGLLNMVVGTPGGSTIITSVYQVILNVIEHNMTMSEAVSAKRFHHQWKPEMVFTETDAFSGEITNQLTAMGHQIRPRGNIGRVDAILVNEGQLEGAADPRGDDHAAGW